MYAQTVSEALTRMLNFYATPDVWTSDGSGDLEDALYRAIGDPDEVGIPEAEWRRRSDLLSSVFAVCRCDLMAFNNVVRHQDVVVSVLKTGLSLSKVT